MTTPKYKIKEAPRDRSARGERLYVRALERIESLQKRKTSTRANLALTLRPIRRLLLLGGGDLLLGLAEQAHGAGLKVDVLTSPRHAEETLSNGRQLVDSLSGLGIRPAVVAHFDKPENAALIGDMGATFALSIGAAWIFKPDKIDGWFDAKLFNLHGTRLPQNRGGGGYSWQILTGNRFGFCQLHQVDGGTDTGPIVANEEFIFPHSCRVPKDFANYATERNLSFMGDLLGSIRNAAREFTLLPQAEYLSTYWPRVHTPTQAWIDWRWRAPEIERFICAFDEPYVGAQTTWRGQTVRLKRAFANAEDGSFHPFQAALVYRNNGRWLCIACDGGSIVIESIESESGESLMSSVKVGDAFMTSSEQLLKRTQRLQFDAYGLKPAVLRQRTEIGPSHWGPRDHLRRAREANRYDDERRVCGQTPTSEEATDEVVAAVPRSQHSSMRKRSRCASRSARERQIPTPFAHTTCEANAPAISPIALSRLRKPACTALQCACH